MTQQLDIRPDLVPWVDEVTTDRITLYGDFNCPWSYLASRGAAVLEADGVSVDWRAVEHDPWRPSRFNDSSGRFTCLREEMDRVLAALLPGEELPYSLAGFVPRTEAAVSGYAEAYAAGVDAEVRSLLFGAFWMHAIDLADARVVRTLLIDAVRSGSSTSDLLKDWGYAVAVSGGPVTTAGWRLIGTWSEQWRATGKETVPALLVGDAAPRFGVDAVEWLGAELLRRGLGSRPVPTPVIPRPRVDRGLASLSWVSQHGNRWQRDYQRAHRRNVFSSAG
jgi:hypothetical protein